MLTERSVLVPPAEKLPTCPTATIVAPTQGVPPIVADIVLPRLLPVAATKLAGRSMSNAPFVNGLAAAITFGIYTPMHINVTCASGQGALDVPMVRTLAEAEAMLEAGETFLLPVRELAKLE